MMIRLACCSFWLLMTCLSVGSTVAQDDIDLGEDAASYFESFYAQTTDWGNFDIQYESRHLIEESDSLSEMIMRVRYFRGAAQNVCVRSVLVSPITDEKSKPSSHRLEVSIHDTSEEFAFCRFFPQPADRFRIDEKHTFEWLSNPVDFRQIGILPFPFTGGAMADDTLQTLRQTISAPDPKQAVRLDGESAVVTKADRQSDYAVQGSISFDLKRLLMTERRWKMEAANQADGPVNEGAEIYKWEMIDDRYRLVSVFGSTNEIRAQEENKKVRRIDQFECTYKWLQTGPNIKLDVEPKELLDSPEKALKFIGMSRETTKEIMSSPPTHQ